MGRFISRSLWRLAAGAGLAAAVSIGPRRAASDVVVLTDGRRLEGIATTSTLIPNIVVFTDHVNKSLQIPRAKIQEIIHESEATSRLKIARSYAREGKYDSALEQIREARRLAPQDVAIQ